MHGSRSVFVVDAHTTGTPIRVVLSGIPPLKGETVNQKMDYMRVHYDHLRTFLMHQPRGFQSLVGAVLTEPCSPKADFGLFFVDALTYQPMCGAGTFSVAKVLISTGMVAKTEPETKITLDTPSGLITILIRVEQGKIRDISFKNVPAFLYRKDLMVEVAGIGKISVDVGFGGNFFTIVDASTLGMKIKRENIGKLREMSKEILASSNSAIEVIHPLNPSIKYMDQVLFYDSEPTADGEYLAQCIFGDSQVDVSPCGTGTSTRLAQRYFRGQTGEGEPYLQKSIFGGVFSATLHEKVCLNGVSAIVPLISCNNVHITGYNHLVSEEDDMLKHGFISL